MFHLEPTSRGRHSSFLPRQKLGRGPWLIPRNTEMSSVLQPHYSLLTLIHLMVLEECKNCSPFFQQRKFDNVTRAKYLSTVKVEAEHFFSLLFVIKHLKPLGRVLDFGSQVFSWPLLQGSLKSFTQNRPRAIK